MQQNGWEFIGSNKAPSGIPVWVLSAFGKEPGSHGTRLIDYPDPGVLYYKGSTSRYKVVMGDKSWEVFRRKRQGGRK